MLPPAGFRGPFRSDATARALYAEGAGIFRIIPAAVAAPLDIEDVVALVRWARETATSLVPRGVGSGMAGHNVGPGVVVDLSRSFPGEPVVDAAARTARVGASVAYRTVTGAAQRHSLRLPPDPSSGAFCTIGGMAACNAAGSHTVKYGAMRAWVRGLEFVTADGEVGRTGTPEELRTLAEQRFLRDVAPDIRLAWEALAARSPAVRKNSSGYDLLPPADGDWVTNLLVGSEGTLAIITAVDVALAPLPEQVSTLLVALRDLGDVAPAIDALDPFGPAAVELLDRTYLDFVRAAAHARIPVGTEAVLLVELESDGRAAAQAVAGLASSVVHADDPTAVAKLWETRHLASPILAALPDTQRSLQVIEDGCVPRTRLGAYIAGLRRLAAEHEVGIVIFGHAGDGHVHANVLADITAPDVADRLTRLLDAASALQVELGGTLAGEHGDGRLRAPYLDRLYGEPYGTLARRTKAAWDPAGILNPGVKVDAPRLTGDVLKVGPAAPAVPEAVATAFRTIEREAAWAASRLDLLS
jgi:FAD/FMN-containing dehydrogenase